MAMFDLIVQLLALSRLLRLFIEEDGPYGILKRFRQIIGIDEYGNYDENMMLAGLFSCHLCLGIWLAPLTALLWANQYTNWVVWCLAVAQGASFVYVIMNRVMYE